MVPPNEPFKRDLAELSEAAELPAVREEGRKFSIAALRNVRYDQQTRHYADEHAARLRLLTNLSTLLRAWLTFVAALLLLQGFLGDFLVAARYVFPGDPRWTSATHPAGKVRRAR